LHEVLYFTGNRNEKMVSQSDFRMAEWSTGGGEHLFGGFYGRCRVVTALSFKDKRQESLKTRHKNCPQLENSRPQTESAPLF